MRAICGNSLADVRALDYTVYCIAHLETAASVPEEIEQVIDLVATPDSREYTHLWRGETSYERVLFYDRRAAFVSALMRP